MQSITKICADSLRAFTLENHGIKLKSAHAHELVAAFFGYPSRAALLADTKYPIGDLRQAETVVMTPDTFVDQRRKKLQELPSGLPDSYKLGEGVYAPLFSDTWWSSNSYPPFRSFEKAAIFLADKERGNTRIDEIPPVLPSVTAETTNDVVSLTVIRPYSNVDMPHAHSITTFIELARVAGHIGYGKPEISRKVNIDRTLRAHSSWNNSPR